LNFNCCFTVHFDKFKAFFCQQMHSLFKHKMLQLTLKISPYMAPTCFGPFGPSSGSIRRNVAKVTVLVEIISKNTSLKLLLCSGNMCFSLYSTQYPHYRLKHILPLHSNIFNNVFLLIISTKTVTLARFRRTYAPWLWSEWTETSRSHIKRYFRCEL
jgi:hypothetical protein